MGKNAITGVIRNDSLTVTATITDSTGLAVNINGYTAYLTVKTALNTGSDTNDDPGLIQVKIASVSDPTGAGIVTFSLTPTNTNVLPGNYVYDVQVISPGGAIYSSVEDNFIIIADVTRSIS